MYYNWVRLGEGGGGHVDSLASSPVCLPQGLTETERNLGRGGGGG